MSNMLLLPVMAKKLSFSLDNLNGFVTGHSRLNHMKVTKQAEFHQQTTILSAHLKVDVPTAVAGKAGPFQFQHGLPVCSLDGKPRHERVPVLFDVAYGGAGRCLDLHLWVTDGVRHTY